MTGFLQQQPAAVVSQQQTQLQTISSGVGGVQELPLDLKAIQDHMAVQALVRSYQVCIFIYINIFLLNICTNTMNYFIIKIYSYRCVVTN